MSLQTGNSHFQGLSAAVPIWIGYAAVGVPFGVLAGQAGLSILQIALMSIIVFAGSSQFIAVSMIGSGSGILPIIVTTFFVNLRHLLMSSTLALHLKGVSRGRLSLLAAEITDETFAVNLTRFARGDWDERKALVVNYTSHLAWIASSVAGGMLGHIIPQGAFGINYALTAMFLALLVLQIISSLIGFIALVSGVLAVIIAQVLPGNWYVIIATVVAATLGVIIQDRFPSFLAGKVKAHDA
ncbi:MAG TPA: AzlC family ABC transporter permease [Deltaproteobacteria bacterium]|nr:AzlC family ABC transporter permease [Deltaproteobacteria bacterium]HPR54166.1 AzlC family ABC transporter permease [Deltaproteobacteria bacterium]HXK45923.1 AzlC family ABC transporter permease [Deltaproteobacteria bacterium]